MPDAFLVKKYFVDNGALIDVNGRGLSKEKKSPRSLRFDRASGR
jgi:hypothetical protein